ncbi:cell wall hydrolase [Shouchella lonarensis]|uniref:N-acetylmuramoyl-L-alanine amidase n=1 Tax=Shouchella lonarensis TaxID=1464122 RepID=A0A1G6GKQ3_9BACI|nr:cell wall hydrolase [Shouchella lonarensis]SDB82612.1 N-acetylmuramoyl-L-alanine amidase [Shouchella lonarensis]
MLKKILYVLIGFISIHCLSITEVKAKTLTHPVQSGDTIYLLSKRYGIPQAAIMRINNMKEPTLYTGRTITIPAAVSHADRELLAKLVHAEAQGEPYAGKVAVAAVVLNRVDHPSYPNNVHDVIYQVMPSGHYAFSPVLDGAIYQTPNEEARRAVNEALAYRGQGQGSLYFYNPATATSSWVATRERTIVIGNHVFAR